MYKAIMIPTDCSGFDREAIRVALRIADAPDATIHLVRVFTPGAFFGMATAPEGVVLSADAVQQECDTALSELFALAAECRCKGKAAVTASLERGAISEALESYARQNNIELIVISSHGRGGISRLTLGSVTDSLIRHTTIPVLVVKPRASYLDTQVADSFRRIVVPLDGSVLAEQVIPQVLTLASFGDAEIRLLYVLQPSDAQKQKGLEKGLPWWEKDVAAAQAYLARIAKRLSAQGLVVTTNVVIGEHVAEEISVYAVREKADLIAIATHGRGGLSRAIRGSVSDAVTRLARACILVFHPSTPRVPAPKEKRARDKNGLPPLVA